METLYPNPNRLTDLSLRHDGPRPPMARNLAMAATAQAAWHARMLAKARFFETLTDQSRKCLARQRLANADGNAEALARTSLSLAAYRHEAALSWSLARCQ